LKSGIPHGLSPSAAAFHGGRTLRNPFGRKAWSTAEHLACVQLPSWPCAHSFRHELAPIEAFQLRIFLYRMHRRFRPQIAQQRVALLAPFPSSLSFPANGISTAQSLCPGPCLSQYGALGAVMILMIWLYVTGLAYLIRGEINAVIERAAIASPQG